MSIRKATSKRQVLGINAKTIEKALNEHWPGLSWENRRGARISSPIPAADPKLPFKNANFRYKLRKFGNETTILKVVGEFEMEEAGFRGSIQLGYAAQDWVEKLANATPYYLFFTDGPGRVEL